MFISWARWITQLHLPYIQLVSATISLSREDVKRPSMFGTSNSSTENNAKVLDIKKAALGQGER